MILKKKHRNPGFTIVDNQVICRPELSAKAKGILLYIMSRPDNWDISTADIVAHMKEGQEAVRSGINELRQYGYMKLEYIQAENGQMQGTTWNAADWPAFIPITEESREMENPNLGNDLPLYNTINTNKVNKKEGSRATLFGDEEEKKRPFELTPLNDFAHFEKEFKAPGLENVDLRFYHGCVQDWSIRKEGKVKRTVRGWLATARQFMRSDIQAKKLKTLSEDNDSKKVDDALNFLKL